MKMKQVMYNKQNQGPLEELLRCDKNQQTEVGRMKKLNPQPGNILTPICQRTKGRRLKSALWLVVIWTLHLLVSHREVLHVLCGTAQPLQLREIRISTAFLH